MFDLRVLILHGLEVDLVALEWSEDWTGLWFLRVALPVGMIFPVWLSPVGFLIVDLFGFNYLNLMFLLPGPFRFLKACGWIILIS